MEVFYMYKNLQSLIAGDNLDGMADIFDDIIGYYYDNTQLAAYESWTAAKPYLKGEAKRISAKYDDSQFVRGLLTAVYKELHVLIDYNNRLRNGRI
jgi:hypothetical protein